MKPPPLRELCLAYMLQDLAWMWQPGRERARRQRDVVDYFAYASRRDLLWFKHLYEQDERGLVRIAQGLT